MRPTSHFEKFKQVLSNLHPRDIDVTKNYRYSASQEDEKKKAHKKNTRIHILNLFYVFNRKNKDEEIYAFFLDCEKFKVARHMNRWNNVHAIIPNWISKTVTTDNAKYNSLDKDRIVVIGSASFDAIKTISSIPRHLRPKFKFFWFDTCNVYGKDQEHELWYIFWKDLIHEEGPIVLAVTYSKRTNDGLFLDQKFDEISHYDNIYIRITEMATQYGYIIADKKDFDYRGILTVVFVIVSSRMDADTLCDVQEAIIKAYGAAYVLDYPLPEDIQEMSEAQFENIASSRAEHIKPSSRKRGRPPKKSKSDQ